MATKTLAEFHQCIQLLVRVILRSSKDLKGFILSSDFRRMNEMGILVEKMRHENMVTSTRGLSLLSAFSSIIELRYGLPNVDQLLVLFQFDEPLRVMI